MEVSRIKKRITKLHKLCDDLQQLHAGKELSVYNYHAGRSLGYIQGQLDILEDLLPESPSEAK